MDHTGGLRLGELSRALGEGKTEVEMDWVAGLLESRQEMSRQAQAAGSNLLGLQVPKAAWEF